VPGNASVVAWGVELAHVPSLVSMVWLRLLTFLVPAGLVAAAVWLTGQAQRLVHRDDHDLIVVVRNEIGPGNPLAPSTGVTREITELLFDRLLRLDDDLRLRPHVASRWDYRHRATVYFTGPDTAAAAYNAIAGDRTLWPEWSLIDCVHDGDLVHLVSSHPESDWVAALVDRHWKRENLAKLSHIRLRVREAAERSLGDFLAGSVEKGGIRQVRYRDDRVADIYLAGESEQFLKELRLYYESNRGLSPEIEESEAVSWVTELDFEITLRNDIRWHDGEPLTADDLLFSFTEATRAGSPWPMRGAFQFVQGMEKINEYAVRARCREYYAPALERWAKLPLLPEHRLRSAVGKTDWEAFFARPVGTGPYRLERLGPGGEVVLGANRDYFRGAPRQAAIRYLVNDDARSRLLGLKLGNIDVFQPDEAERRWALASGDARVMEDVSRYQSFVAWNLDRPLFGDARTRRALADGLNLPSVIAGVANGHAEPWRGLFFPGSWFCEPVAESSRYDFERAAGDLAAAGWKRDGDTGVWTDAKGGKLAFTLAYDSGDALHAELADALRQAWKIAGIDVRLEPMEWSALVEKRLAPRDFDALLLGWELDFTRDQWAVWHSSQAGPGGSNFSGLKDPEVDRLLTSLRETDDEAAVTAAAGALQNRIVELQPCLFLCGTGRAVAIRKDAVIQSRPGDDGEWTAGPVQIGRAGLHASRPWWIRSEITAP
jgi:peptide/nickel transport system substrate-binding protein